MSIFTMLIFVVGAMFLAAIVVTLFKWHLIQNQSNYLANSQGKYGGYTTQTHQNLLDFTKDRGFDPSMMEVTVSAPDDPVPWGTPVSAKITCKVPVSIGKLTTPFYVDLSGEGWDISRYVEGKYAVTYTSP